MEKIFTITQFWEIDPLWFLSVAVRISFTGSFFEIVESVSEPEPQYRFFHNIRYFSIKLIPAFGVDWLPESVRDSSSQAS